MSRCTNCFRSGTEKIKKLFKEKAEEGRESFNLDFDGGVEHTENGFLLLYL